jgi:primosomal protein N' (replication factor Y)
VARLIAKIAVSAANYQIDRPYDYLVPDDLADRLLPGMRVLVPFSKGNRKTEGIVLGLVCGSAFDKLKYVGAVLDESPVMSDELIRLALWMRERFFCTVYEAVKAMLPAGLWYNLSALCRITAGVGQDEAFEAAGRSETQRRLLETLYARGGNCEYRELERVFGESDPVNAVKALAKKGIIQTDSLETRRIKDKTVAFVSLAVPAEAAAEAAAAKKRSAPAQAAALELLISFGGATVGDIRYMTGAGPSVIKRLEQGGLVVLDRLEVYRRPEYRAGKKRPLPVLTGAQEAAFGGILSLIGGGKTACALLHGVTGSGKTAVYVHLIGEMLKNGLSSALLVPEIALTPQMMETFSAYFGDDIAVMHSALSAGERYDEWKRIKTGRARVLVGTRSAIFAPLEKLGLIIIDEEQEETYKSENAPRYHTRDIAKFRCAKNGAFLLLGSATPDIVSRYNAETGKYAFFSLPERYNRRALPQVTIVDMKKELRAGNGSDFSAVLTQALSENLSRGEQSILFLNRRGMYKLVSCGACGYTYKCPRCSVGLTYHGANNRLMCHYCGYSRARDAVCPECSGRLGFVGSGTQKIEEELNALFPGAGLVRMDTDTVASAGSHDALLSRFRDERVPILVGTQMVTKGLDFPNVTLVGVLQADQSLYAGDYRASERTFSLITQVVGRSGRGDTPGRAVIQTFTPQNQVILQAAAQDYGSFYASELEMRRIQWCPPFSELFSLTAVGQSESAVLRCLCAAKSIISRRLSGRADLRILGPAPLPVVRVNNSFRYRLTLACADDRDIRQLLSNLIVHCNSSKEFRGATVFGDLNAG